MGDLASDTDAQLEMMIDAYIKLKAKSPNHELLKLAKLHEDKGGFDFTSEYQRKCVSDKDELRIQGYMRYTQALKEALQ